MKIWCIGSAVVDILAAPVGDSRTWQEKQRISRIELQTGGDAVNQSIRLADLGAQVYLSACIGKDNNGIFLRESLRQRGVNTSLLSEKSEYATGTALVLVNEDGERHTFSVHGAHSSLAACDLPSWADLGFTPDAISLASLFSMPVFEKSGLLEFLKEAQERKIPVFADLASDKLQQGLKGIQDFLPYIHYFLPSEYDALSMTNTASPEEAARVYRALGVPVVIIKCGERGCYYQDSSDSGLISATKVTPVDTTGAGDCMAALFLSRILSGDTLPDACKYACHMASLSTLDMGASAVPLHLA